MSGPITNTNQASRLTPISPLRRIEADVTVRGTDKTVRIDGDVYLDRTVLPNALGRTLGKVKRLDQVKLAFDASSERYMLTGAVKIAGARIPVSATTAVRMDGPTLVLSDTQLKFPLSGIGWASETARDKLVEVLNKEGLKASRSGNDIRLDASAILQEIDVLPQWASLAPDQAMNVRHDAQGNVRIHLGKGPEGKPDGVSQIRGQLDPASSERVLGELFGSPKYEVKGATFSQGQVRVNGLAAVPEVKEAVNGLAALAIAALGGRGALANARAPMAGDLHIPLSMDVRTAGGDLVITPSLKPAVAEVAASLTSERVKPTINGRSVSVPTAQMLPGGSIDRIAITPAGLEGDVRLDVDSLLKPHMLK